MIRPLQPRALRAAVAASLDVSPDALTNRDYDAIRKSVARAIHTYQQEENKPRIQCERCKDWNHMGLSNYCPSCDAEHYMEPPALTIVTVDGEAAPWPTQG